MNSTRPLPLALGALALASLLSGCVFVAGAGIGYVVSQEVLPDNSHEARVTDDVDRVWTVTQETMEILHDVGAELEATHTPRSLETEVDGADVRVEVEAIDLDLTLIRVSARKFMATSHATAEDVMKHLLERLEESKGE
jgi:hypothetical protein